MYYPTKVHEFVTTRKIKETIKAAPQAGEVAVEFELEGDERMRFAVQGVAGFTPHRDDSLGAGGIEMVFEKPVDRTTAAGLIQNLFNAIPEGTLTNSDRCSTHVHLNVQEFTMQQIVLMACLYYIYENKFFDVNGGNRKGNIFCLSLEDSPIIADNLINDIKGGYFGITGYEDHRYTALNFAAVNKFGSLEFRSHKGADNAREVIEWMNALLAIYDYVKGSKQTPSEFFLDMSREGGVMEFTRKHLPAVFSYIKAWNRNTEFELWEGARRAQDVAFAMDWVPKIGQKTQAEKALKMRQAINLEDERIVADWAARVAPPRAARVRPAGIRVNQVVGDNF